MKGSDITQNNKSPTIATVEIRIPNHIVKVSKNIILQPNVPEHRISTLFYLNYNRTIKIHSHIDKKALYLV